MNFLKRLFGVTPDPTAEWPQLAPSAPTVNLRTMMIGPLRFRSPPEDAQALGRPDRYTHRKGNPELHYAREGFSLEYEEGGLVEVTYFTGPEDGDSQQDAAAFSQPTVIVPGGATHKFGAETGVEALVAALGKPGRAKDESRLQWEVSDATIVAELNEHGRLWCLNIFLTN